jgi:HK97 family phage major capsid protein
MALTETLSELLQRRQKLHDEAREMFERADTEKRGFTKDEEVRHLALCGTAKDQNGEIFELDKRISQINRLNALDKIGHDERSGRDPFSGPGQRLSNPLPHEDPANTRNGLHNFRVLRAAQGFLPGGKGLTGLEAEVSKEIEGRTGIPSTWGGFKIPYYTRTQTWESREKLKRALDSNQGAGSIPTILEADWIELLRNKMVTMDAGAREILDLKGKFAIPRQNAAATAFWVAESASPTGTNQTLDQVLFTPHTLGAFTDISRRFFELTILDSGETFVKEDLTAILGIGIDLAALNGAGNSFQPLGILQNTGITSTRTVSNGTNGGAPTWASVVELQTVVNRGNAAALGNGCYIGNADVEGTLATTLKIGNQFPIYLLDDDGKLYRKPLLTTQQLPNSFTKGSGSGLSPLIYGIWNQLMMAYWSGIDILVDPYTGSSSGTVRIVALIDMDIQVRHNEAFSVMVDMVTDQSQ